MKHLFLVSFSRHGMQRQHLTLIHFVALIPTMRFQVVDPMYRSMSNDSVMPLSATARTHQEQTRKSSVKDVNGTWNKFRPCYLKLCWCNMTYADCSRTFGKLTFIPKLPEGISYVNFSHNDLKSIRNDTFFTNVTKITGLDLSSNKLSFLSNGAFDSLTSLKYLDLGSNLLDYNAIYTVFSSNAWKLLTILDEDLHSLPSNVFSTSSLPSLEILTMGDNPLTYIDLSDVSPYMNLTHLAFGSCKLAEFTSNYMPALTYLNLHSNGLLDFPETCRNKTSLFPVLQHLDLRVNEIYAIPDVCLPKLQVLDLSKNNLNVFLPNTFSYAKFPSLLKLYLIDLEGLQQKMSLKASAFNNSVLQVLSLGHNNVMYAYDDSVDLDAFAGCSSLNMLQLEDNVFTHIRDEKMQQLFGQLPVLGILYLDYTEMVALTTETFKGLTSLRELYLDGNPLISIPHGTFDHLMHLTILSIARNKISSITEDTFSVETRNRLSSLDLSGNAFTCSCDIMWFRQWFISNRILFAKPKTVYQCNNIYNTNLSSFYLPEQACLFTHDAYTLTVVSVTLLLVTLTVTAVLYHYRWHIRLLLYEAFRDKACTRRQRLLTGNFQYDVFVSYAAENLVWVRDHLMPELEVRLGLRLCVHQRDFIPGNNIVDNIVDNLQASRKVMLIFSRDFARSQWCQFELALCLQHVMDHDDVLVIICLQDLASRDLTGAMLAVLKTTTYIQWGDDDDARTSFWGRMEIALNEIIALKDQ